MDADYKMLTISLVIQAITGELPHGDDRFIRDAVIDSRHSSADSLFIALPGEKVDGHVYVEEAFVNGSIAALIDQELGGEYKTIDLRNGWNPGDQLELGDTPICILVKDSLEAMQQIARFWRKQLDVEVIGITGSVGKSTTKEVVAEVLNRRYKTLKSPGNLNNEIGLPLTLLKLNHEHERAVLEMGFYIPGEIDFLCDLALPKVGVVTNVGTVHAERAGTIDDIVRGKSELVKYLPPAPDGLAILNYDDPLVKEMANLTEAQVFSYGLTPEADLWADNVVGLGLDGIRFRLHYRNEVIHLRVPLIGRHSVHTALRAAAVGLNDGLSWQGIVDGLQSGNTQLRLVAVRSESGAIILDDTYNASPESTLAALNLLDDLDGKKIAVLGDMLELGQYEKQGHDMVGARVAEVVDELVTIGDKSKWISTAAVHAGLDGKKVKEFENSEQSVDYLKDHLDSKDVVLVKGSRGMQMEIIVTSLETVR
jgi:UDP-N-acetylmuramoyl-tripeptide--D-alanyl-D-alanine ligase